MASFSDHTLPAPTIDLLLNLIDTRPASILSSLTQHPHLASASDSHGYSLVHASASYAQLDVLRELILTHEASPNLVDEDGETALFTAETVTVAKCLVEELGADWKIRNNDSQTAEEKIGEEEGETNEVFQYLRSLRMGGDGGSAKNGVDAAAANLPGLLEARDVHPPPPLPDGVKIEVGTMAEDAAGEAPDPEIRRRIEELAARDDFQAENGQRLLRQLVSEVVGGITAEHGDAGRNVRRRVD